MLLSTHDIHKGGDIGKVYGCILVHIGNIQVVAVGGRGHAENDTNECGDIVAAYHTVAIKVAWDCGIGNSKAVGIKPNIGTCIVRR